MPPITALLHTTNDALRLGRALETILPCKEILIVDHGSSDATRRIAKRYGAHVVDADGRTAPEYAHMAMNDWILCLDVAESLTENLQASLFEWGLLRTHEVLRAAFNVVVREQMGDFWRQRPTPETRLVRRPWASGKGRLPAFDSTSPVLEGHLLRVAWP